MNTAEAQHADRLTTAASWQEVEPKKVFTADEGERLFDAGMQEGVSSLIRAVAGVVNSRVNELNAVREEVYGFLRSLKLHPLRAYLTVHSPEKFRMLFFLPQNEFYSEQFSQVYSKVRKRMEELDYCVTASFSGANKELDHSQVLSDGYSFFHVVEQKVAPRAAQ